MSSTRTIAYNLGKQAAFEKVALGAFLTRALSNPAVARTLGGAALGAGTGALTAGEGERGRGALLGGALGGLAGGLGGRAVNRAQEQLSMKGPAAIQSALWNPKLTQSAIHGVGGAGLGTAAGLAGGLGARATAAPEPTWQDKLKALPGQAYQGMQSLLGG